MPPKASTAPHKATKNDVDVEPFLSARLSCSSVGALTRPVAEEMRAAMAQLKRERDDYFQDSVDSESLDESDESELYDEQGGLFSKSRVPAVRRIASFDCSRLLLDSPDLNQRAQQDPPVVRARRRSGRSARRARLSRLSPLSVHADSAPQSRKR